MFWYNNFSIKAKFIIHVVYIVVKLHSNTLQLYQFMETMFKTRTIFFLSKSICNRWQTEVVSHLPWQLFWPSHQHSTYPNTNTLFEMKRARIQVCTLERILIFYAAKCVTSLMSSNTCRLASSSTGVCLPVSFFTLLPLADRR